MRPAYRRFRRCSAPAHRPPATRALTAFYIPPLDREGVSARTSHARNKGPEEGPERERQAIEGVDARTKSLFMSAKIMLPSSRCAARGASRRHCSVAKYEPADGEDLRF